MLILCGNVCMYAYSFSQGQGLNSAHSSFICPGVVHIRNCGSVFRFTFIERGIRSFKKVNDWRRSWSTYVQEERRYRKLHQLSWDYTYELHYETVR